MMTCRMDREEIIRQKEEYGFDEMKLALLRDLYLE